MSTALLYKKDGPIDFIAGANLVSGQILALGTLKGVVVRDAKNGEQATLDIGGIFRVPSAVTAVGTQVTLVVADQNAVATAANAVSDGIVVGVYETGVALVRLERGRGPDA